MTMRLLALLAVVTVLIAACGASSSTPVDTATAAPIEGADDAATDEPAAEPAAESDASTDVSSGGESADTSTDEPATGAGTEPVSPDVAAETAAANQSTLQISDDPLSTEILVVADGSVTSLRDAATGDRPLLLWFWAPH